MISEKDLNLIKKDSIRIITISIVSHLIHSQISKEQLFNDSWKDNLIGTLLGFSIYHTLSKNLTGMIISNLNIQNNKIKDSISDSVKFGTVLMVKHFYKTKSLNLSNNILTKIIIMIVTFALFHTYIKQNITKISEDKSVLISARTSSILLATDYFTDYDIEDETLGKLASKIGSIFIYNKYLVKHLENLI